MRWTHFILRKGHLEVAKDGGWRLIFFPVVFNELVNVIICR